MVKRVLAGCAIVVGMTAGCDRDRRPAVAFETRPIEDTLRAIVMQSFRDLESKNADGVLQPLSEDVLFVGDGIVVTGKDSLTRLTTRAFSEWRTVKAEAKITKVMVLKPDIAVVNWESHVAVTDSKGNSVPLGGIVTALFVNRGGRWQIIQQQQCAPMPPEVPRNMKPTEAVPES